MATRKIIWWRPDAPMKDGKRFANVHLLVSYNQSSVQDYMDMAEQLRETFPEATNDDVRCGKVHKSDSEYGSSIIHFDAYIDEGEY
jgi:hypothetical protein